MSDDRYGQHLKKPLTGLGKKFSTGAPLIHINFHDFLKDHIQTRHRVLKHHHFLHTF